jgi:hypothetical protein
MFLVSCVSAKRSRPLPARELYCSDWFVTARDYVEAQAEDWYILSAKYGLVEPDEVIEPYNETLSDISSAERRAWAERVAGQVRPKCREEPEIVILAGQAYQRTPASHPPELAMPGPRSNERATHRTAEQMADQGAGSGPSRRPSQSLARGGLARCLISFRGSAL